MYEAFYGFSEDPFRISPDHRFSYPHRSYLKAKNYLEYGLLRAEGIVLVTGEPGTGKSTVINDILSKYDSNEFVVAKLLTTRIDSYDLLRLLAYSFGLDAMSMDKATVLTHLEHYLNQLFESGQRALLIVDEAQNLSIDSLEELRLLSNLQQYEHPLLQIFLIGQPKLQELIRSPFLEQLRQRLVAACHFEALNSEETRHYIEHRLSVVGWQQDPRFTDAALSLIHRYSGGIPRRVNLICNRLLLHGHVESLHKLGVNDVQQVIAELPPEMTIDEESNELASITAAASSSPGRRKLSETDSRQTRQAAPPPDPLHLHRRETSQPKAAADATIWPNGEKSTVTLHANTTPGKRADTSRTLKKSKTRQHADTDPLLSLTSARPLASPNKTESKQGTATAKTATRRDRRPRRSSAPKPATPSAHIRIRRRLRKHRSWMRPTAAGVIFVAVFGISYGYLKLNPGKYLYSTGTVFQPNDLVAELKDPANSIGASDSKEQSETYIYAQKETSSDLLNLTMSSLLPGPEDIQDMGISESSGDAPPASLSVPDAENTLRNIQNQELEKQSTQIIEEVIGDNQETDTKVALKQPQRQIKKDPTDHDEKTVNKATQNFNSKDAGVESKRGRLVINRDLENALRHYNPTIERLSSGSLKITLQSELSFQVNSVRLKDSASRMLDKLAFVMRNYDGFQIQILAQKNNGDGTLTGTADLSRRRAKMVASHLIDRGISAHRVQPGGVTGSASGNDRSAGEIGIYLKPEV